MFCYETVELTLTLRWTHSCGRFVQIFVFEALHTLLDRAVPLNLRSCLHEVRKAMTNKESVLCFLHTCTHASPAYWLLLHAGAIGGDGTCDFAAIYKDGALGIDDK